MRARIFQPPKTAMQSGWAKTQGWAIEFVNGHARVPDPLMGWSGGGDTQTQVKLTFETRQEAIAYAERAGLQALLFVLTGVYHTHLGMRSVIVDYIHGHAREWALVVNSCIAGALGMACVYAVLRIGFV